MSIVVQLRQKEAVSVDSMQISAIFRKLGPSRAESAIMQGIQNLTTTMHQIDTQHRHGDLSAMAEHARSTQILAMDLGLVSLTMVLGALSDACRNQDRIAATALWDRAKRTGDRSLVDLWELPQLQM